MSPVRQHTRGSKSTPGSHSVPTRALCQCQTHARMKAASLGGAESKTGVLMYMPNTDQRVESASLHRNWHLRLGTKRENKLP